MKFRRFLENSWSFIGPTALFPPQARFRHIARSQIFASKSDSPLWLAILVGELHWPPNVPKNGLYNFFVQVV